VKLQSASVGACVDTDALNGILETARVAPTDASKRQTILHPCAETDARNDDHGRYDKGDNVLVQTVTFPCSVDSIRGSEIGQNGVRALRIGKASVIGVEMATEVGRGRTPKARCDDAWHRGGACTVRQPLASPHHFLETTNFLPIA